MTTIDPIHGQCLVIMTQLPTRQGSNLVTARANPQGSEVEHIGACRPASIRCRIGRGVTG